MAAQTVSRALINDTDANFRAWGKAISDQFTAGGWTKTSDTGQIDWTTAAHPTVNSTATGYEIWSSNDSGGGLNNFYVKIEYGSSAGGTSGSSIGIWLTVGWATDGAGSITGIKTTRTAHTQALTPTTTPVNCNLAAGSGWVAMSLGTAASLSMMFSIERTRNSSLAVQNEVVVQSSSGSGTVYNQCCNSVTAYPAETTACTLPPVAAANAIQGGVVGLGIIFASKGYFTNPMLNQFLVNSGQLGSAGGTVSVTSYGAAHTYIILTALAALTMTGSNSHNTLLRFE